MAPRGRTRKRLGRMDAAVDAMASLGFDEHVVKITVKKLLKEYGGDEWWPFIEEYSYKELIEAILRAQEEDQNETQKGVSSQDERPEDLALESTISPSDTFIDSTCNEQSTFPSGTLVDSTSNEQRTFPSGTHVDSTCNEQSAVGPSGTLVNSTCNEASNTGGETDCSEPVNAVGEPTDEELCSNKQHIDSSEEFRFLPAEGGRNRWTDIGEDQPSIQKGMANAACNDDGNSVNQVQLGSKSHIFAPPPTSSPGPVNHLKVCFESRALQAGRYSHVATPPSTTSPCPVNCLKMCSGSQLQSQRNSDVSTPPPTSSSCRVSNLKMSSGQLQSPRNSHVSTPTSSSRIVNLKMSYGNQVQSPRNSHVSTAPPTSSSYRVSNFKMSSGSQVQSPRNSQVSIPPSKSSSCRVNNLKMSSGSQVQSLRNFHVSAPPPTSSSCQVSSLKISSRSMQSPRNSHVSAPPPTSSVGPVSNIKMSSGSQVQSQSNSHVSTPSPTSSCTINTLPLPDDHRQTTLPSSKPVGTQPPRRHFPCYGWIESDDEGDDDDFVHLQPMKPTTPLQSQNSSGGTTMCMKRKSRWDICPNDP